MIEPYADYMIASEELEPGHGWLWSDVVDIYANEDSIANAGRQMVDAFVQDVHGVDADGKTLSLLDLSQYDDLVAALDPLLRDYSAQIYVDDVYSDYLIHATQGVRGFGEEERSDARLSIDLKHFAQLLEQETSHPESDRLLSDLIDAVDNFVVHSNHDGTRPNSFGIAIDDPSSIDTEYATYMVSDAWIEFENAWNGYLQTDAESPEIVDVLEYSDGTYALVVDENLSRVSSLYGFTKLVEYDDGLQEAFFTVVAEEPAYETETPDEYFLPAWDRWWFVVEYDQQKPTAWIPAFWDGIYEVDGETYEVYTAEIDYQQSGKDYTGSEQPNDLATLSLVVDVDFQIVGHHVDIYQVIYSGPDDLDGTVQFDKATHWIEAGDAIRFWNLDLSLDDPSNDIWVPASDWLQFTQEPRFDWEFLEFEDETGEVISFQRSIWAEDASGNAALTDPETLPRAFETPFGTMREYVDAWGAFEVLIPLRWFEIETDPSGNEFFAAIDPEDPSESTSLSFSSEWLDGHSVDDYADIVETALLETWENVARYPIETYQQAPAVILEASDDEAGIFTFVYVRADGFEAFTLTYTFAADQFSSGRELAYYSFDTFIEN